MMKEMTRRNSGRRYNMSLLLEVDVRRAG
jgi:hypothetical protein